MVCQGYAVRGFDVTIPPPDQRTLSVQVAIFYSFWIWLIAILLTCYFLSNFRRLSSWCGVLIGYITLGVNEFLKRKVFKQPRPEGTCLTNPGMPSSHSSISIGLLTILTLEMVFHVWPLIAGGGGSLSPRAGTPRNGSFGQQPSSRQLRQKKYKAQLRQWWMTLICIWCSLLPIPWARVVLKDHSLEQVVAGSCLGCLVSIFLFIIFHFKLAVAATATNNNATTTPKGGADSSLPPSPSVSTFDWLCYESKAGRALHLYNDYPYPEVLPPLSSDEEEHDGGSGGSSSTRRAHLHRRLQIRSQAGGGTNWRGAVVGLLTIVCVLGWNVARH